MVEACRHGGMKNKINLTATTTRILRRRMRTMRSTWNRSNQTPRLQSTIPII